MDTRVFTAWLSFADPDKPRGQQFLGVAIVDVHTDDLVTAALHIHEVMGRVVALTDDSARVTAAVAVAHTHGCNPGGQVAMHILPEQALPDPQFRHRLLSMDDLRLTGLIEWRGASDRTH